MRRRKTKCKRGHCFTKKNTYVDKHGARNCLKCRRLHSIARSKNPGIGSGGFNRAKTHCSKGHELVSKNIWKHKGERRCRICSYNRASLYRAKLKKEVFEAYGGKCAWPGCNTSDIDMLTIDHVNNDGQKERMRGFTSGDAIYRRAKKENFPSRYQCLCANHNLKKQIERVRAKRVSA